MHFKSAIRRLRKRPFTFISVTLILGISIGWLGALFATFESLFIRPLEVEASERLVRVFPQEWGGTYSYPNYLSFKGRVPALESFSVYFRDDQIVWQMGSDLQILRGNFVSFDFFETVRPPMFLGNYFRENTEGQLEDENVVVLAYHVWQKHFAERKNAIGAGIQLNNELFTVIGITAPGFKGLSRGREATDLWIPVTRILIAKPKYFITFRNHNYYQMVGRLAKGATHEQARVQMATVFNQVEEEYPGTAYGSAATTNVIPEASSHIIGNGEQYRQYLLLLSISVLLLIIACANIANIMFSNVLRRHGELSIRRCLGASGFHLFLPFFYESMLIACSGGALGAVTLWLLLKFAFPMFEMTGITVNFHILALITGMLFIVTIALAFLPYSFARRLDLNTLAKEARTGIVHSKTQRFLLGLQVVLSTALLAIALMFMKSVRETWKVDYGFKTDQLVLLRVNVQNADMSNLEALEYTQNLKAHLLSFPEIETVGVGDTLPLRSGSSAGINFEGPDAPPDERQENVLPQNRIGPDYFQALDIPLLKGRLFETSDHTETHNLRFHPGPLPLIVTESFVRRYYTDEEPLGKIVYKSGDRAMQIVGVVPDFRLRLREDPGPIFFIPHDYRMIKARFTIFYIRANSSSAAILPLVKREVERFNRSIPISYLETIESRMADQFFLLRAGSIVVGCLAVIGLFLSGIGIWALIRFDLANREREIAIRLAIGASCGNILFWLVRTMLLSVIVAYGVGILAVVFGMDYLKNIFFNVEIFSWDVYLIVFSLLAGITAVSLWHPMRRIRKWNIAALFRDAM